MNAADNDTKYTVSSAGFLQSGTDLLGSSTPAFSIDSSDYVDVPSTTTFDQLQSTIGTDNTITYTMNDLAADDRRNAVLGTAQLVRNSTAGGAEEPASGAAAASTESEQNLNSALSAQGTDKTADAEQKDSITKLLHSIQSFYYSVGHNGTIYINMTALVLTLSILVFAIAVISCIGAAVSHARALRRRRSRSYRRR